MRPSLPVVVVLVAALVTAPVAVAAFPTSTATTGGDGAAQPGAKLSGAVAAQGAELDGEVRERSFDVRLSSANDSTAKAAVVADEIDDVQARLDELRERKQRLLAARRNGSISRAEFRTRMAELAVETATVRRLANRSERVARGLPAEALAAKGVNVTAIQRLQADASNLTGPEVAAIARSVAGNDVGKPVGGPANRSNGNGPPDGAGNGQGGGQGNGQGNGQGAGSGQSDGAAGNLTAVVDAAEATPVRGR